MCLYLAEFMMKIEGRQVGMTLMNWATHVLQE